MYFLKCTKTHIEASQSDTDHLEKMYNEEDVRSFFRMAFYNDLEVMFTNSIIWPEDYTEDEKLQKLALDTYKDKFNYGTLAKDVIETADNYMNALKTNANVDSARIKWDTISGVYR
jgi:GMP synthase PP-ATPase subunit